MMLEETKAKLEELVIELHNEARSIHIQDSVRSLELRKIADEISKLVKQERERCYT